MATTDQNGTMYIGESKQIACTVTNTDGSAQNLVGATITWALYDDCGVALITKTTPSGITFTAAAAGQFYIQLSPSDTESLDPGIYYHKCIVTDSNSITEVVFTGYITLRN